jgi:hypothetical protein
MNKEALIFSIFTFVAVVSWIFFDITHTQPSVPVNPKLNLLLEPVNPSFDQNLLNQIKQIPQLKENAPASTPRPSPINTQSNIPPINTTPPLSSTAPLPSNPPAPSPVSSETPQPSTPNVPIPSPSNQNQ